MLLIEGLIGAGKTELAKRIAQHIPMTKIYFEPVDLDYLSAFYGAVERFYEEKEKNGVAEPPAIALELQFNLMAKRFEMHLVGWREECTKRINTVFDRSIWFDKCFASMLHSEGLISDSGMRTYLLHRRNMESLLHVPSLIIMLEVDPVICLKRIKERDREGAQESKVTYEYLVRLRREHDSVLEQMRCLGSDVIHIDWNEFGTIESVMNRIMETGRHHFFGVDWVEDFINIERKRAYGKACFDINMMRKCNFLSEDKI